MTTDTQTDVALATTAERLALTPDIIVDQLEAAAIEHYQNERLGRARGLLEKLLLMRPEHAPYWTLLGVIYRRQERRPAALTYFRKALTLAPTDRNTLVNLGETLVEAGEVDEGIKLLRAVFDSGRDPAKKPAEQDPLTIRAGADLAFIQAFAEELMDHPELIEKFAEQRGRA